MARWLTRSRRLWAWYLWPTTRVRSLGTIFAYSVESSEGVLAALRRPELDPFLEICPDLVRRVLSEEPDVVGISVAFRSQLICGLALAAEIKRQSPGRLVVLGGSLLAYLGERLAATAWVRDIVDVFVTHEGERPMLEICRAVGDPSPDGDVPRIRSWFAPLGEFGRPDFRVLPMGRYWSPVPVIPVLASRGCYYGGCSFCDHYANFGPGVRERPPEEVAGDLLESLNQFSTDSFYSSMSVPGPTPWVGYRRC